MKQITAVAFSTLVACVVGSTAFATDYADLKFTTNDWYTAQASSLSTMGANGQWKLGSSNVTTWDDKTNYVDSTVCIEVDTDATEALTFEPSTAWSADNKFIQMDFNVYAATVPNSVTPTTTAKVGFAIRDVDGAGTRKYIGFVGGENWIELSGVPLVDEGASYKLTIQIDNRESTQKVRFLVNNTNLTYSASEWINLTTNVGTTPKLGFVGMGYFSGVEGDQLAITAEKIVVPEVGNVVLPEAVVTNIVVPSGKTVEEVLAATDTEAGNNLKMIDNIVLGLRDSSGAVVDGGKIVASGNDVGSTDPDQIKLNLNITPPANTGATVTFQLYGADESDFSDEGPVGSEVSNPAELAIPLTGTVKKFYRVKASVAY